MILFTSPGSYVKGPVGSDANIIHNNDGSCTITDQTWAMSDGANSGYVPISPSGKTYYYDITYSNTAGNLFYIGVEKFDSNKKSGSNNECHYIVGTTKAADHIRVFGTVDLSTANGNPAAYAKLRILNAWNGADSNKVATIHECIFREESTLENFKVNKNGVVSANCFAEGGSVFEDRKNGIVESPNFIEI